MAQHVVLTLEDGNWDGFGLYDLDVRLRDIVGVVDVEFPDITATVLVRSAYEMKSE